MAADEGVRSRLANAPFDDGAADIVLRSSDGVDFRTYKLLLSLISSFFRDMLSLPHVGHGGSGAGAHTADRAGRPVVEMEENGESLERLLRWCDPRCTSPSLSAWNDVETSVRMLVKYDAQTALRRLSEALQGSHLVFEAPIRAYSLAVRSGNRQLAQTAAREASRRGILEWETCQELEHISGLAHHRLLRFHNQCTETALRVVRELEQENAHRVRWNHGGSSQCQGLWFKVYIRRICDELEKKPSDTRSARLLTLHENLLVEAPATCSVCNAQTLQHILRFCSALKPLLDSELAKVTLQFD